MKGIGIDPKQRDVRIGNFPGQTPVAKNYHSYLDEHGSLGGIPMFDAGTPPGGTSAPVFQIAENGPEYHMKDTSGRSHVVATPLSAIVKQYLIPTGVKGSLGRFKADSPFAGMDPNRVLHELLRVQYGQQTEDAKLRNLVIREALRHPAALPIIPTNLGGTGNPSQTPAAASQPVSSVHTPGGIPDAAGAVSGANGGQWDDSGRWDDANPNGTDYPQGPPPAATSQPTGPIPQPVNPYLGNPNAPYPNGLDPIGRYEDMKARRAAMYQDAMAESKARILANAPAMSETTHELPTGATRTEGVGKSAKDTGKYGTGSVSFGGGIPKVFPLVLADGTTKLYTNQDEWRAESIKDQAHRRGLAPTVTTTDTDPNSPSYGKVLTRSGEAAPELRRPNVVLNGGFKGIPLPQGPSPDEAGAAAIAAGDQIGVAPALASGEAANEITSSPDTSAGIPQPQIGPDGKPVIVVSPFKPKPKKSKDDSLDALGGTLKDIFKGPLTFQGH